MYQITEQEFNFLKRVIANQIACYNANIPHEADELWSIGVYAIGKACAKYDPTNSKAKFTTYASSAIINNFRCWFRDQKKRMTDGYIDAVINDNKNLCTFHEMITTNEHIDLDIKLSIKDAMKVLSEKEYTVVTMYMEGYSQREIAEELGYYNRSCVSRTLSRAYDKMRTELEGLYYV